MKLGLLATVKDTLPGIAGNAVIVGAGITSAVARADLVLHFMAVTVGILASIATTVYYVAKYLAEKELRKGK